MENKLVKSSLQKDQLEVHHSNVLPCKENDCLLIETLLLSSGHWMPHGFNLKSADLGTLYCACSSFHTLCGCWGRPSLASMAGLEGKIHPATERHVSKGEGSEQAEALCPGRGKWVLCSIISPFLFLYNCPSVTCMTVQGKYKANQVFNSNATDHHYVWYIPNNLCIIK